MDHYDQLAIDGKARLFFYEVLNKGRRGRLCRIESEHYWKLIDNKYTPVEGDMPETWLGPAIASLRQSHIWDR